MGPGPVLTGAENLTATGIRSPCRPARNQSLYQLRYPAHCEHENVQNLEFSVPVSFDDFVIMLHEVGRLAFSI